jgi:hypothetical protein
MSNLQATNEEINEFKGTSMPGTGAMNSTISACS